MSIENEKIPLQNENDSQELDQYGVWVKTGSEMQKSNTEENISDTFTTENVTNVNDIDEFSIDNFDFDTHSESTAGDAILDEDLDAMLDSTLNSIHNTVEYESNFDDDDATLTVEELSNIAVSTNDNESTEIADFNTEEAITDVDIGEFMDTPTDSIINEEVESVSETETQNDTLNDDFDLDLSLSDDDNNTETNTTEFSDIHFDDEADETEVSIDTDDDFNISFDTDESEVATSLEAPAQATVDSMSSELLQKIVTELAELRTDINQLKTKFSELPHAHEDDNTEVTKGSGFFSDDSEDETIALSGDELNNILVNADFTTEKAEEDDENQVESEEITEIADDLSNEDEVITEIVDDLHLEEKELEEPDFSNIDFDIDDEDDVPQTLPEEIDIPVFDDLVVASSEADFLEDEDIQKEIDENSIEYLAQEPVKEQSTEELTTAEEVTPIEEIDSLTDLDEDTEDEPDTEDSEPIESVFESEQWQNEEDAESLLTDDAIAKKEDINSEMTQDIKAILSYMDQLLENLPEEKIAEFAKSDYFDKYKKLFTDLGLA